MTDDALIKFDPLKAVFVRNKFYKDAYRKILCALILSFLGNIILGSEYYYLMTHPEKPVYFAVTVAGRILPVYPLNEPNQSDAQALTWAKNAAMAAFTYNYTNYRKEFQSSSDFFTPWGWSEFLNALKSSNNLDAIKVKKLVVSAQLGNKKLYEIRKQGIIKGRYAWRVKVPLLVTYQSTEVFTQERTIVTLLIVRQSTLNSPSGIGIDQFVVSPG